MATAQQKVDKASDALNEIHTKDAALARDIARNLVTGGFKYTSVLKSDVMIVRGNISPALGAALDACFSDPAAMAIIKKQFTDQITSPITTTIDQVAPELVKLSQQTVAGAAEGLKDALSSLSPIAGLFQANLWLRVAEVGLGLLLVAVGVAKLTNAVPIATKIAAHL